MSKKFFAICSVAFIGSTACDDATGPSPASEQDVRPYVSGEALAALDNRGQFVFPDPVALGKAPMHPNYAHQVGAAYFRQFVANSAPITGLVSLKEMVETAACGQVNWPRVQVRARWLYGEEPMAPVPDTIPVPVRNAYGPKYFFQAFDGRNLLATIVVAANAENVYLDEVGRIVIGGPIRGNEFRVHAMECGRESAVPPTPEEAVHFAATTTGRKVVSAPVLLLPGRHVGAGGARWRLELDSPITVRGRLDGVERQTRIVYVSAWPNINEQPLHSGADLRLSIPAEQQPDSERIDFPEPGGMVRTIELRRHPERFIDFVEVAVVR